MRESVALNHPPWTKTGEPRMRSQIHRKPHGRIYVSSGRCTTWNKNKSNTMQFNLNLFTQQRELQDNY